MIPIFLKMILIGKFIFIPLEIWKDGKEACIEGEEIF